MARRRNRVSLRRNRKKSVRYRAKVKLRVKRRKAKSRHGQRLKRAGIKK